MDPIKLLKDDHKKVKALFREFEAAGDRAHQKKQKIAEQVFTELEVHTTIEEEIFYPALQAKAYVAKFTVLIENVEHHIEEEEGEVLPDAQKTLGDQLDQLGERMMARKQDLMASIGAPA